MGSKSDLQVLHEMQQKNLDIKSTTSLVEMKMVKQGGLITMGIDRNTYHDVSKSFALGKGDYYVITYIINAKQFNELKNE